MDGKRAESTSTSPSTSHDEGATDKHLIKDSSTSDKIPHTYQGVVLMWKRVLYAETEKAFEQAWRDLCKEFDDQRAILQYLYSTFCLLVLNGHAASSVAIVTLVSEQRLAQKHATITSKAIS